MRLLCLLSLLSFLLVFATGADTKPDKPLDVSKLKKGDQVEVQWGGKWLPGEYVEKLSPTMVRVKTSDVPLGMPYPTSRVRLPAKAAKADKAKSETAENPFATEDEKVGARKSRTWTDKSGKFKVEAKLLRVEGEKVVLQRQDGKEIAVALDKFTDADKKYVAEIRGDPDPSNVSRAGGVKGSIAPKESEAPVKPSVELTETDLNQAELIDVATDEWKYTPAKAARPLTIKNARITLHPPTSAFESPKQILLLPGEKKAFVVYEDHSPGQKEYVYRIQACDLGARKVKSVGILEPGIEPIDISPDGGFVVARPAGFGLTESPELRLFSRDGDKATPLSAWLPYGQPGAAASAPTTARGRPPSPPADNVQWTSFISPRQLLTVNSTGELVCWEIPSLKPLYRVAGTLHGVPALTANREHLAIATTAGVAILAVGDGKPLGLLSADTAGFSSNRLAFRQDGARLALCQDTRLRVWDLDSQELLRDFPVETSALSNNMAWVDDDHLLLGPTVYSVERRIPIWTYAGLRNWIERDGVLWFVVGGRGRGASGSTMLASATVPPKAALDGERAMKNDGTLAIRPGLEVAVELPPQQGGTEVLGAIVEKLEKAGLKVVAKSNVRLVGTIQPGKTTQIQYHAFGSRQGTSYSATEQVLTLSWLVDNAPVWKYETRTAPPGILRLEQGTSIQQEMEKRMRLDPATFTRIWIPVNVPKPDQNSKKGVSATPAD